MELTIDGLNARQRFLADIIWQCETRAQINTFIRGLPTVQLQDEAKGIVELMIMATIEQCYDGLSPMAESAKVLQKYNRKKS